MLLWITLGIGAALVIAVLWLASRVPFSSETLKQRVVAALAEGLDARVELAELRLRVFPRFHAEGRGLTIRHGPGDDGPPLISVKTFAVNADLVGLVRKHVADVTLTGLEIDIQPGRHPDDNADQGVRKPGRTDATDSGKQEEGWRSRARGLIIDNLTSHDATLAIIPSKPDKAPKIWAIHTLHMRTVAFDRAMPFVATLTNGIPPGEIETTGSFGPWHLDDPGATPLDGIFTFAKADLGVFKGISGVLSAHGEFGGSLGRISVHGQTDTPDFTVALGGHPVPLHTEYRATVDGTNGDTRLDRIDAKFLKTALVAKGSVIDAPGKAGRTVTLDVTMEDARLEDVLRLAVKQTKSPMVGALKLSTTLVLPPGERDVVDKLRLAGRFSIARVKFTDLDVQQKLDSLSHISRGKPDAQDRNVVSNFNGRFTLADGALALRPLEFNMPGARVQLAGSYRLRAELLDFTGTLFMDATISQTQKGLKRVLLKVIDPLFRRDGGGSAVPIKIEGQRNNPAFGLDKGRVLARKR